MLVPVLAPVTSAGAPEPQFAAPFDVKNTVTGLAADARGRFVAVAVDVAPTAGGLLGGSDEKDVYAFDFSDSGGQLWSNRHAAEYRTGQVPTAQHVAFAAGERSLDVGRFVVGGPGSTVSLWNTNGPTPIKEKKAESGGNVAAVAILSDGSRSAAAVNPTSGGGRVYLYDSNLKYVWDVNLTDAAGGEARATALEVGRHDARALVIGTNQGIWIVDPRSNVQPSMTGGNKIFPYDTDGSVTSIAVSFDGRYVLAGTSTGCFYYFGPGARGDNPQPFNRCIGGSVTDVALTLDGARFAIGKSDGTVHFYERESENGDRAIAFADPVTKASKYALSNDLVSLAYDSSGRLLVATTTAEVVGFHNTRVSPIWTASAADLKLDTPLKGAVVGDSAESVIVAGRTKVLGLEVAYDANVTVPGGLVRSALPGDTVRYTVNVKNTGSAPDTYTWKVQPPAGWTYDPPQSVTLLPDESATVQVNLTSPTGSRPGYAESVVGVQSQGKQNQGKDPLVRQFVTNVSLSKIVDVDLAAEEREITLDQGQEVTFPFTVQNRGNDEVLLNLSALQTPSRGSSWSIRFADEQLRLGPDGSATTSARITAPQDGFDGDFNRIRISAKVGTTFAKDLELVARVNPEYNIDVEANATDVTTRPGRTTFVKVTITNNGNTADAVNLTTSLLPVDQAALWRVTLDRDALDVPARQSRTVSLGLRAIDPDATEASVTLSVVSQGNQEREQVTISMRQEPDENGGFLGLPAPGVFAALAALGAAAFAARAPHRPKLR